ncbi:MAG TPA: hypothetical protein VK647_15045 [Gemmatimonadales bacterium]|nr:hypothetical protein [Gemmatimonadales bacterium]
MDASQPLPSRQGLVVTLILVPVLYAVFVLDLEIVKSERLESH